MTLNWSTLVLEVINFLVLMWLLQHFLYRPVQRLLERRQSEIAQKLLDAEQRQQQAETLHQQYQRNIDLWQQQQLQVKAELQVELERHRQDALEQLQQSLQANREKEQVILARQREQQQQHDQQRALSNGCRFASRLLQQCSSAELEQRLIRLFIEELRSAPDVLRQALRREISRELTIETSVPLAPSQLEELQQQLKQLLQRDVSCNQRINPQLIAGIRVTLGGRILGANIEDELQAFADIEQQPEQGNGD